MTIETWDPNAELDATTDLPSWVALLAPTAQLAERLADTEFVPTALRKRPAAITAAILYGYEIGIGPMQALRSIDIVQGRPTPSAELLRAMIYKAGHEMWVVEATGTRVTVGGRRAGSAREITVTWTSEMARAAGLNGKDTWRKFPRQMLFARATSELARVLFPDAIRGLGNLDDTADVPVVDMPDEPAATGKTVRRARRTIETAPPVDPPTDSAESLSAPSSPAPRTDDDETPSAGGVTTDQMARIAVMFRELGITDRDQRLSIASAVARRKLTSSTELQRFEASDLITALDNTQSLGLPLPTWNE